MRQLAKTALKSGEEKSVCTKFRSLIYTLIESLKWMYVPNNARTGPLNSQCKDAQTIAVRKKKTCRNWILKVWRTRNYIKKILCSSDKQVSA